MVQRDRFFRRRSRKGDYTEEELKYQRAVWSMQIGQSMVIEVCAIIIHALCVALFLPHRFVFNLGYGVLENTGVAISALAFSTVLELVGEFVSDHLALHAELNHDVPVERYFQHTGAGTLLFHFGGLLCSTGVVLWNFSRVPTAVFCILCM